MPKTTMAIKHVCLSTSVVFNLLIKPIKYKESTLK